jgi:alpha-methylacyl-CoA racemase
LAAVFATRDRDDWARHFADSDACVTPVLTMAEAPAHPHNAARGTFVEQGVVQPAPAPRFDGEPPTVTPQPPSLSLVEAIARWR